ncbi:FIST C-terminal domain-containing protein [Paucibacter sp. APW11]|uniref:FIST C-terminal domain-containing protein n=1 Tax=Roseateles aquae TaxID=3077235 RepID=A0ABU3PDB4_9BURK|nr:FIST N-terminal domain-containing protein [Paucibacter sp. APW11]MDT9000118.1 FIST C-terminal domain-containing protein [Paucibacter sp. APW11]
MPQFLHAHATHPDAHLALALAGAQIEAQRAALGPRSRWQPSIGWLYLTEAYVDAADSLLTEAQQRWPGVQWLGASGVGVCASGVEYFDEPALSLMLADLPAEQFHLFSGRQPLGHWPAALAQLHGDPNNSDLQALITDLAGHVSSGYVFGGLAAGRKQAIHIADGVWHGGLSGVAFGAGIGISSRVSQGCQALGATRRISACEGQWLTELDGQPALDCLLQDLALPLPTAGGDLREAVPRLRRCLAGLSEPQQGTARRSDYGAEVTVRHLMGIDPARRAVAVGEQLHVGQLLSFCERNPEAARRDLLRICTELRDEAEDRAALASNGSSPIAGALYISCAGRGGSHFGAPSAELQWIRHALGDVPLTGFFAAGEIAHDKLYGYTGVLTVFLKHH